MALQTEVVTGGITSSVDVLMSSANFEKLAEVPLMVCTGKHLRQAGFCFTVVTGSICQMDMESVLGLTPVRDSGDSECGGVSILNEAF